MTCGGNSEEICGGDLENSVWGFCQNDFGTNLTQWKIGLSLNQLTKNLVAKRIYSIDNSFNFFFFF